MPRRRERVPGRRQQPPRRQTGCPPRLSHDVQAPSVGQAPPRRQLCGGGGCGARTHQQMRARPGQGAGVPARPIVPTTVQSGVEHRVVMLHLKIGAVRGCYGAGPFVPRSLPMSPPAPRCFDSQLHLGPGSTVQASHAENRPRSPGSRHGSRCDRSNATWRGCRVRRDRFVADGCRGPVGRCCLPACRRVQKPRRHRVKQAGFLVVTNAGPFSRRREVVWSQ